MARNYAILGDTGKQRTNAEKAADLLNEAIDEKSADIPCLHALSSAYNEIGDVQQTQGNLCDALISYQGGREIDELLVRYDPKNVIFQQDLGASYSRIGDVQIAQGDLAGTAGLDNQWTKLQLHYRI